MKISKNRHVLGSPVLLVVLFLVATLGGCSSQDNAGESKAQTDGADSLDVAAASDSSAAKSTKKTKKPRERTTSIRAAKVVRGNLVVPIMAEGTVRSRHSAEILAEITGRLVQVSAEEGQLVRTGTLIAKLDDREYNLAVSEARATYLEALSRLAIEEDSVDVPERPAELQEKVDELARMETEGLITREERLAREITLDVEALKDGAFRKSVTAVRTGVTAARALLERAKISLERTEVRAPFTGVVTGLELSVGEQLTTGQVICSLVNVSDIEASVGVLESDIGSLERGRPALLSVPALEETLQVNVDVVSPLFDKDSRACQVLLRLKNTGGRVRPGMYVRAMIAGKTYEDRLMVPKESIITRDGRPLLFKVEDGRAKWLYVQLGHQNDNVVEIKSVLQGGSLSADDLVVVSDHLTLSHDAKIKVKKVVPTGDPWSSQ